MTHWSARAPQAHKLRAHDLHLQDKAGSAQEIENELPCYTLATSTQKREGHAAIGETLRGRQLGLCFCCCHGLPMQFM